MLSAADANELVRQLADELDNFLEIAKCLWPQPDELPRVSGIDLCGGTIPLGGVVGGDHIVYLDFKQQFDLETRIERALHENEQDLVGNLRRCQRSAGVVVLDVSGHRTTDAALAAIFHQAFLVGAVYELDRFGEITNRLFEHLNTRLYRSFGSRKFVSMCYGEISEDSDFRFLSAGQPFPVVFSRRNDRIMEVDPVVHTSFPPLGIWPSAGFERSAANTAFRFTDHYAQNEWSLMGQGDILILHTDGLAEHRHENEAYFPARLEATMRQVKHRPAGEIFDAVKQDILAFGAPSDDISLVVIKRA